MIPPKRQPGQPIKASEHNAIIDAAKKAQLLAGENLATKIAPGGTSLFRETPYAKTFWGRITALGPNAEADYADERYWVKQICATNAAGDSTSNLTVAELTDTNAYHITATNLAELGAGTHTLEAELPVKVYIIYDSRSSANIHYVFTTGGLTRGTSDVPYDMLPATPEASESAQADDWEQASPSAGSDGVTIKVITRIVYDDTSDEALYGYYRELLFDSAGLLVSIGAETRYTIETPGACP